MLSLSRRARVIFTIVFAISALIILYYIIFPSWVRNKIEDLGSDSKARFIVSVEKIHATVWPVGLLLNDVSIYPASSATTGGESLHVEKITIEHIGLISLLFRKTYSIGHLTLHHPTGAWSLPSDDDAGSETNIPFNAFFHTITLNNVSLHLRKEGSDMATTLENGNMIIKDVVLHKDSLFSSIGFRITKMDLESFHHVSPDSLYTFRAHNIQYSDKDSLLQIDSFFTLPNEDNYTFTRMQPFQTDRVYSAFKNISIRQCHLNSLILKGDLRISSIHTDTFVLDIFRDRRRPFLHKKRPLFQDLLHLYPGVLSIDSIIAQNGNIKYTEHDIDASKPGFIWFSDVNAVIKNLYNDTSTLVTPHDTLIVAAHALAMGKGKIQFELKGKLSDPQNTFVFNGSMENISVAAFNPILIPNATIKALDGYVRGIYFNFRADNSLAQGDLIFRYQDLSLLKVDEKTRTSKGLKNRLLTRILKRKIIEDNPLPNDTLRTGTIHFERDQEKMFFWYMLKSIFSGIKETVIK